MNDGLIFLLNVIAWSSVGTFLMLFLIYLRLDRLAGQMEKKP